MKLYLKEQEEPMLYIAKSQELSDYDIEVGENKWQATHIPSGVKITIERPGEEGSTSSSAGESSSDGKNKADDEDNFAEDFKNREKDPDTGRNKPVVKVGARGATYVAQPGGARDYGADVLNRGVDIYLDLEKASHRDPLSGKYFDSGKSHKAAQEDLDDQVKDLMDTLSGEELKKDE